MMKRRKRGVKSRKNDGKLTKLKEEGKEDGGKMRKEERNE